MKYSNEELLAMEEKGIDLSTVDMGPIKGAKVMPPREDKAERYTGPVYEKGATPDRQVVCVNVDFPPDMLAALDHLVTRLGLTRQDGIKLAVEGFMSDKIRALKELEEFVRKDG